ncbi:MAG: choice-of-anchor J domain-containing protein [Muribaculaceae bacterium]|nr:choice-of-anchor J domain-containing protein [Muribaculaceae bacterium]
MKKSFTLLAASFAVFGMQAADQLFGVDFSAATADDFAKWTVVDANADGSTWGFAEDAVPSRVFYSYSSANNGDDWLISPAVSIPEAGLYVISLECYGSSYGENLEVWSGNAPSAEGMTNKIAAYEALGAETKGDLLYIDAQPGDLYLGLHAISLPDKWRLYINKVAVLSAANPVDIHVSGFVSPVSGEGLGNETVTVTVTNSGRMAVEGFDVSYSLNDGETVTEHCAATLGIGESIDYTFAAKADLSQGHFTHTLKAWTSHPDDLNPANDAMSVDVKHIAPASVPYFMGFEPTDDLSGFTFLNLNEDDGDWGQNIDSFWMPMARNGYGSLCYNYSKQQADDWAIFEPIEAEPGYYAVKFWYSATENHKEKLRVFYGNQPTVEAMTNLVVELDPIENPKYEESISIIKVDEEGRIYFGFHCYSDADENWLCIDDFSVTAMDPDKNDIMITRITTPTDYLFGASTHDVNFRMQNVGINDVNVTLNYYLGEDLLKSTEQAIRASEILDVKEAALLPVDLAPGTYTFKVEAIADSDTDLSNNVLEKSFIVLGDPVAMWDFEDGLMPTDLTLRKEDTATDHPDAGEEFNADGFGIFNLEHSLLGKHALAVNTWFTDDSSADRWVVLPQMKVTGSDVHFAWTANSYNEKFPEYYNVKVSDSDDVWYNYSTLYTNKAEEVSPQTHGLSLAAYEGKEIYIAVNVRTSNGEVLVIDNLGVYGDIEKNTSGVDCVGDAMSAVKVEGDLLKVYGTDTASIEVYAADGRLVAKTEGCELSLSGIAKGIYVARASTAEGTSTIRFIR